MIAVTQHEAIIVRILLCLESYSVVKQEIYGHLVFTAHSEGDGLGQGRHACKVRLCRRLDQEHLNAHEG